MSGSHTDLLSDLLTFSDQAYRVALRFTGDRDDAEDVLQEAFVRAVQFANQEIPQAERLKWFLGVVRTVSGNLHRKEFRRRARERKITSTMTHESASSIHTNRETDIREAVASAVGELDSDIRVALCLHYEEGLSYADVSEILKTPEVTLRKLVSRGVATLREKLARKDYAVAPSVIMGVLGEGFCIKAPASLTATLQHIVATGQLPAAKAATLAAISGKSTAISGKSVAMAMGLSLTAKVGIAIAIVACAAAGTLGLWPAHKPLQEQPADAVKLPDTAVPIVNTSDSTEKADQRQQGGRSLCKAPKILREISLPAGLSAKSIGFDGKFLWVHGGSRILHKFDPTDGHRVGTIGFAGKAHVSGPMAWDGTMFICGGVKKFYRVDVTTGTIEMGKEEFDEPPNAIAFDAQSRTLYASFTNHFEKMHPSKDGKRHAVAMKLKPLPTMTVDGRPITSITGLAYLDNALWVGTRSGWLYRFNHSDVANYCLRIPGLINYMTPGEKGFLWVLTGKNKVLLIDVSETPEQKP